MLRDFQGQAKFLRIALPAGEEIDGEAIPLLGELAFRRQKDGGEALVGTRRDGELVKSQEGRSVNLAPVPHQMAARVVGVG